MKIPVLTSEDGVDALEEAMGEAGCAILEGAMASSTADAILAELSPFIAAAPAGGDNFLGERTKRVGALMARSPSARQTAVFPSTLELGTRTIGKEGRFQLHCTQIVHIGPEETPQPLHRDRWTYRHDIADVETQLNTMWALTDFTAENGATRLIPGSHRWDAKRKPAGEAVEQAAMPKGSVLYFNGSIFHGGGANRSDAPRTGMALGYSQGWLRQEENQYLACPPEIARGFPLALQELVGYGPGGHFLGYFADLNPPSDALGGSGPRGVIGV